MSASGSWVAPPNWPAPPTSWTREPRWRPDPAWGPAPAGWVFRPRDARRARVLAAVDASLIAGFLGVYLLIIRSQGNTPALWLLAFLTVAGVCALVTAVRGGPAPLIANLVIVGLCAFLGLLSIGVLLLPAGAAGAFSYTLLSRAHQP